MRLAQRGLLYRVCREGDDPQADEGIWERYRWRNIDDGKLTLDTHDYSTQMIMADFCMMRASSRLEAGNPEQGKRMLARAAEYGHGVKEFLNNLGSLAAEHGLIEVAMDLFHSAIEIDPRYITPRRNIDLLERQAARRASAQEENRPAPWPAGPDDPMALLQPYLPPQPQTPYPTLPTLPTLPHGGQFGLGRDPQVQR